MMVFRLPPQPRHFDQYCRVAIHMGARELDILGLWPSVVATPARVATSNLADTLSFLSSR